MKTVRAHEVQAQADKRFGPKLKKLEGAVKALADRIRELERKVGSVPVAPNATIIKELEGPFLNEGVKK